MIRSYSSAVNPRPRARSSVTFGSAPVNPSPRLALEEGAVLDEAAEERVEDQQSVGAAHRRLRGALRMWHESQHGPLLVDDARDVPDRAVGVRGLGHLPL